jgi:hypothetical protein
VAHDPIFHQGVYGELLQLCRAFDAQIHTGFGCAAEQLGSAKDLPAVLLPDLQDPAIPAEERGASTSTTT